MNKQSGFMLVEGLLIVLVLSVIGFSGYYVWNQQQNKESKETETVQQQQDQTGIKQEISENKKVSIPEGWIVYENETLGFSFAHPQDWTIIEDQNEINLLSLILTSTDFVENTEGAYGGTIDGTRIYVSVSDINSEFISTNEKIKNGTARKPAIYTEIKDIETNENVGISYIVGYEGPRSYTYSYEKSGKIYRFTLEEINSSEDSSFHPNIETFEDIVDTAVIQN